MKSKAIYGSDIYLSKATCFNPGLNHINVTTYVSSDLDADTLCLQNQMPFATLLGYDLEPDTALTTTRKIVVSGYLSPYISKLNISVKVDEDSFLNSPFQPPRTTIPSPKPHDFDNQHR